MKARRALRADRSLHLANESRAAAAIGHNQPPPDPTPYELAAKKVEDIYSETVLWLDGKPIDSQELADGVGNLLAKLREAEAFAEAQRVAEKKPLDEKIADIQTRYNALIGNTKAVKGKTILAADACKKALAPWLVRVAAEQAAAALKAREEADALRQAAEDAIRASDAANLAEREAAEALIRDAKKAETAANRAEHQTATAGRAMGRSISLRSYWTAVISDPAKAGRWGWTFHKPAILEFITGLAQGDVASGKREIDGFTITEEKRAV